MSKNYILPIPLSSLAGASFTGSYVLVATLPEPCLILRMYNNSNRDVTISFDGSTDNDIVPMTTVFVINAQANAGATNFAACFRAGTKIYAKAAAGAGTFYISGYFQPQS